MMKRTLGMLGTAGMTFLMIACTSETNDDVSPAAELGGLESAEEGTSYLGWTQGVSGLFLSSMSNPSMSHTLGRTSGDATRGGGGCVVIMTGTGCSGDATCLSNAQSIYGSSAWGYCYQSQCYYRPTSQLDGCALNPNRSPGTLQKNTVGWAWGRTGNERVLGCMTKTAGPNTACGGTDTQQYMRTVGTLDYSIRIN